VTHKQDRCQSGLTAPQLFHYAGVRNLDTVVPIATFQRFSRLGPKQLWPSLRRCFAALLGGLAVLSFLAPACLARTVTLAELRADPKLTPERLMGYFADFKFELGHQVRQPETFLANRSGDCDDFATLAADLLREKGYSTRLVVVFMPQDVHVVCYVAESHSYLDYNRRKQASPLVKCEGDLGAIAASVAESFRSTWRSASEFTFRDGGRHFVSTVFR
jgi:hypothetical protein